ncbi:MAG: hypothetical protein HQK60_10635 [Deltaproteobacteria bacterium]|nr:hypothetical protein [Deltaproteobacteria bacterium]
MDQPDCFGQLERVFPMTHVGLRMVTLECRGCPSLKGCLKAAVDGKTGADINESPTKDEPKDADQADVGVVGFLKRWSVKKEQARQQSAKDKKEKS